MKRIAKYDELKNGREDDRFKTANLTIYRAYIDSLEADTEDLNFNDVIWEKDIDKIIETCREENLKQITISSSFSSLTNTLWEMIKYGCKITGMKLIPTIYETYNTDTGKMEKDLKPAIIIEI